MSPLGTSSYVTRHCMWFHVLTRVYTGRVRRGEPRATVKISKSFVRWRIVLPGFCCRSLGTLLRLYGTLENVPVNGTATSDDGKFLFTFTQGEPSSFQARTARRNALPPGCGGPHMSKRNSLTVKHFFDPL